ncbi:hypothetical protein GMDG_02850 [Pseudogymnoascus destructans 20631-21]|uniref:Uncharacterized protein n=2 Tax=Pseudogymnoascus destructans TaxID=655981 RepID=L8G4E9_PSED2|nr:hypothetical protein GMDG_02850 [Pseudogymnoascus destructans 20631-21]
MVEWSTALKEEGGEEEEVWEVSWEGKARGVVYGSGSATVDESEAGGGVGDSAAGEGEVEVAGKLHTHRLYFLLPPQTPVPRLVNISRQGDTAEPLHTNPLPAIFPPELGLSARTAGRKGVLHTRWAKRRLAALEVEIEREGGRGEGVGWEMAVRERVWIEENFGVGKGVGKDGSASGKTPGGPLGSGGRMGGLKVGTSPGELGVYAPGPLNPLSPAPSDVAIAAPAFALFHAPAPSSAPEQSVQTTLPTQTQTRGAPAIVSQLPPVSIVAQQAETGDGQLMSSLDALAAGGTGGEGVGAGARWTPADAKSAGGDVGEGNDGEEDAEGGKDELFAIPPRERGPEMARSPFSLVSEEVVPWR